MTFKNILKEVLDPSVDLKQTQQILSQLSSQLDKTQTDMKAQKEAQEKAKQEQEKQEKLSQAQASVVRQGTAGAKPAPYEASMAGIKKLGTTLSPSKVGTIPTITPQSKG